MVPQLMPRQQLQLDQCLALLQLPPALHCRSRSHRS
jgi:hypothetical protein